jgi:hypothetical protein
MLSYLRFEDRRSLSIRKTGAASRGGLYLRQQQQQQQQQQQALAGWWKDCQVEEVLALRGRRSHASTRPAFRLETRKHRSRNPGRSTTKRGRVKEPQMTFALSCLLCVFFCCWTQTPLRSLEPPARSPHSLIPLLVADFPSAPGARTSSVILLIPLLVNHICLPSSMAGQFCVQWRW